MAGKKYGFAGIDFTLPADDNEWSSGRGQGSSEHTGLWTSGLLSFLGFPESPQRPGVSAAAAVRSHTLGNAAC